MPQDPNKSNKPVEITAKSVGYKGAPAAKYRNVPKDEYRRIAYGEKAARRPMRGEPTITTANSRSMRKEGVDTHIVVGAARANARAMKETTPNSVISSEFTAKLAADKRRSTDMWGPRNRRVAAKENTQRLAAQAAKMRSQLDARKPTGATMDQKDKSGKTQTKQPPRPPVTQQSSGGGGSTPPRRPSTSSGGGSGSGGSGGGSRRGRGAVGAAMATAAVVGGMAGRMSKRGDEVAAYNKGKADGRTFTPSGMRSAGQNVAQPTNTSPGVRDNMFASSNLRKLMMKGK